MKSVLDAQGSNKDLEKTHLGADSATLAKLSAVAQLRHPHLVAMRAVPGKPGRFEPEPRGDVSVAELSRTRFGGAPVPLSFGLRILLDALSGLAALHKSSLAFAHGEFAPSNVLVGRDGTARLIPVVAAHWEGEAAPSADASGYAAPERLRGDPYDSRADVFSAGVLLWEMITNRSFRSLAPDAVAAWIVDGKVPDPVHPDDAPWVVELAAVAIGALQVDPGARLPNVGVMGAEIENATDGHVASSSDVAELLRDAAISSVRAPARASEPPAEKPLMPSLSPTAVSISPTVSIAPAAAMAGMSIPPPPIAPTWDDTPPSSTVSRMPAARSRSPRAKKRGQSFIAWSTLLLALGLLAVATHELFNVGPTPKANPAAAGALPVEAPVAKAPPAAPPVHTELPAPAASLAASPSAPVSTDTVVPPRPTSAAPQNVAASQRAAPQAPARPSRPEPLPRTQAPARAPSRRAGSTDKKGTSPSDNPFGI